MNEIPNDTWQLILPKLKKECPRLTGQDLQEAQQRIDLLTAKIQNRHWVSKVTARRMVLLLLKEAGAPIVTA